MSTEFISFQPPPGDAIANYDRKAHYDEQSSSIPATFREAMSIREEIFVKDQGVPLENELDEDDARSYHWVVYASVGTSNSSPPPSTSPPTKSRGSISHSRKSSRDEERRASESTASRVAVGTIRLVPPPHSHDTISHTTPAPSTSPPRSDSVTTHWEPSEPYIKLGRIATLAPYRGLGLSKLLVNAALGWAVQHGKEIVKPLSPAETEAARLDGGKEQETWKGLVVIHAQTHVQGMWGRFGFVRIEEMGTWIEEGIEHVGMWVRIPVEGVELPAKV